jgi:predicted ATPase with chaperone activity
MLCASFWSFLIDFVRHDARIAPQKSNKTASKIHHKSSAKISKQHLCDAMERMNMSARAYDRILKVARTIADLEACADVLDHHIMEAIA